jgi:hypothetical protein
MDVLLKQCDLVQGNLITTGWVPSGEIKEGYRVTLDGHEGWWTVQKIYDHGMLKAELRTDRESHLIHDKDHHRKMLGLNLGEVK